MALCVGVIGQVYAETLRDSGYGIVVFGERGYVLATRPGLLDVYTADDHSSEKVPDA